MVCVPCAHTFRGINKLRNFIKPGTSAFAGASSAWVIQYLQLTAETRESELSHSFCFSSQRVLGHDTVQHWERCFARNFTPFVVSLPIDRKCETP